MTTEFATFWAGGALSPMERACLSSFIRHGKAVTLYSFEPIGGLPDGVITADAGAICSSELLHAYRVNGRPSVSHFADHFRFALFERTGATWIDSDVVLVDPLAPWPTSTPLLALEEPGGVCNAVLSIPRDDPHLARLVTDTRAMAGHDIAFGATGRTILTSTFGPAYIASQAAPSSRYFPIHYNEFYKFLLPEHRDEAETLCRNAVTLHLWNNILVNAGYWKSIAPPEGSYLAELFARCGADAAFTDRYPADVMRKMVDNYLSRDGQDLGIIRLSKLIPGALKTTIRRLPGRLSRSGPSPR